MQIKTEKEITTKTGFTIKESWCRKCSKMLPVDRFYEATDGGIVDSNGLQSVCKNCIQTLYNDIYKETQSMEKTIHRLCILLNVKYSNDAADGTKAHINTLHESGKHANSIFGIYKSKLIATNKSMDKSALEDLTYSDVGTIYTEKQIDTSVIPIPEDLLSFWGRDLKREEIEFLETNYVNFKNTHKAETYAEIVLLKEVCYTMLNIKKLRANNDDTEDAVKELQSLMKNLAISPNIANANAASKGAESFGLWIQDIEKEEPAQWLKTDPRGEIYRDVGDVEAYFQKYIVRPIKNFIAGSKDFNVEDNENIDDDLSLDSGEGFALIDDGTLEE